MKTLQITVNDETIDYTLENEKNLFEVLGSLRAWLQTEGFVLTGARTDERDLDLNAEDELQEMAVDSVAVLRIDAQTLLEKEYQDLAAIGEFFQVLKSGVEAGDAPAVKKVLEDYEYLRDGLDGVLDRRGIDSRELRAAVLDDIVTSSGILTSGTAEGAERERLFTYIGALSAEVAARMREMEQPSEELAQAASDLKQSIEQLGEVSVMLQTGRDQEAMTTIIRFVELSSRITRLYPLLRQTGGVDFNKIAVEGVSFPEFYAEFNTILAELIDAFSAEDSVLIGDLLEYEITPRLEKLKTYIDLLTQG